MAKELRAKMRLERKVKFAEQANNSKKKERIVIGQSEMNDILELFDKSKKTVQQFKQIQRRSNLVSHQA